MKENERERITRALQMRAEQAIPDQLAPPQAQLERWRTVVTNSRDLTSYRQVANSSATTKPSINVAQRQLKMSAATIMVGLLALATLGLALILATRPQIASPPRQVDRTFVPEGKVRHVVISTTHSTNSSPTPTAGDTGIPNGQDDTISTQDLWYTNGEDHLLLYFVDSYNGTPLNLVWVDEQNTYHHSIESKPNSVILPGIGVTPDDTGFVLKLPYTPRLFEFYGPDPDIVTRTLKLPGGHVVGTSLLGGRPVIELETASAGGPDELQTEAQVPIEYYSLATPEPQSSATDLVVPRWHLWIDTETHQVLQSRHTQTHIKGSISGVVETLGTKVMLDEVRDLSEFPPDYFRFKMQPDWRLIDNPTVDTAIPTPRENATP